jgi:hypothetical protein
LTVVNEETKDFTKESELLFNGFKIEDESMLIKSNNNNTMLIKSSSSDDEEDNNNSQQEEYNRSE